VLDKSINAVYTSHFSVKKRTVRVFTHYGFRVILRVNNRCFPEQHQPAGVRNGDAMRSTNLNVKHYLDELQAAKCF
jgi:hypothetical protein